MRSDKKQQKTMSGNKNEWTWQEISKHDRRDSAWMYVGDNVYDVTPWMSKHPGGEQLILLFAGRDCTEAMRAYHPFTEKPSGILEKLKIGKLKGPSEVVRWNPDTGFYKTIRDRCTEYFKKNKINPFQQNFMYEFTRMLLLVIYPLGGYLNLGVFQKWGVPFFVRLIFSCFLGLTAVLIALNISHMCSHQPLFRKPKLNYFLGWFAFDALSGLSFDLWLHEHVVGHHQYTNIITIDPNVPEGHGDEAMFRSSPNQKWYKRFYYQFLWVPLSAFIVLIEYRLAFYRYWFKGYRKEIRVNSEFLGVSSLALFLLGKFLWILRVLYLPVVYCNVPIWEALVQLAVSDMTAGYFVGINFAANHVTNKVDWPVARKDEKTGGLHMDSEWAISQVKTCKDYAYESWFFSHILGALNNHSCHHLFPPLHHSYYAEIYPIVKQTAKEWDVKLPDVGTYGELVYDFVKNLWDLGSENSEVMHHF